MVRKANRNSNVASHIVFLFVQKKAGFVSFAFCENMYKITVPK